jgi:hypothetical protein
MATGYHLNVGVVSRGQGQSVIAKAAYNAREKLTEERTGEVKDYTRKQDRAVWSGLFVDKSAPAWAHDREKLWNAADAFEKRKDAQIAYNVIAALPHELTDRQREFIVKDFAREQFLRRGVAADVHIHEPSAEGDDRNHHVHMLVSMREMTPEGFGKRRVLTWEDKEQNLARWREQWAERCAKELEKAGHTQEAERWREGHRDLEHQRRAALERGDTAFAETLKDRQATKHRGPAVDAMERRGKSTERGDQHRETVTAAQETAKLKRELAAIERQIAALEHGVTATRPTPRKTSAYAKASADTRAGQTRPQPAPGRFQEAARETTAPRPATPREVPIPARPSREANDNRPLKEAAVTMGRAGVRTGRRAGRQAVKVGGAALHAITSALESLFAPPTPKTAEQIKDDQRRAESAANDAGSAWDRYARTEDYERHEAAEREAAARRQRESDEWRKRQERERER